MEKTVKIFLDDVKTPIKEMHPPANFQLDTTQIADGPHTLTMVATSSDGVKGIKKVDFVVRNGPEIELVGMKHNDVLSEQVDLSINAYGSESKENFIVAGSETPKAVPAWLWVIIICFISWGAFYLISNWN
ncbi:cytochrome C [Roseivirga sp. E12]|uniref:cytochrome C n=1 Tax=Roseivirga sp. E12 TaxID=2819237 RepID=UPI001ABCE295|nr:cytochrome C [Roseivirga sp. E12]MBO3698246.1 cytochrome C [Roseivirga sp. E12]